MNLVRDPATEGQADQAGHTDNNPGRHCGFLQRHEEVALQHRHQKRIAGIGGEVETEAGHHQPQEGWDSQYTTDRSIDLFLRNLNALGGAAFRLPDEKHEDRQDQPGHRRDKERRAPAIEGLDHRADGEERQQQPQRQPQHEDAHGPCPAVSRKQIADQRVGGWRVTGFADADAHAHDQEAPETAHHAVDGCQTAPYRQPPAHQLAARAGIGHAPQRQAGNGVDDGECRPDDPQLEITEVPFHANGLDDDGRDGAVEKIEQVGQEQQEQNAPGIGRLGRVLHGSVSFIVFGASLPPDFAI
ncbi:hypothetical protein D3C73_552520 [compost metagenome]